MNRRARFSSTAWVYRRQTRLNLPWRPFLEARKPTTRSLDAVSLWGHARTLAESPHGLYGRVDSLLLDCLKAEAHETQDQEDQN